MSLANFGNWFAGGWMRNALGSPASSGALGASLASALVPASTQVPQLEDLTLEQYATPEELAYLGDLQLAEMSPTELRKILLDPRLEQAQFDTLSRLDEISNTGMSAIDRARLADIQAQQATEQRGMRESILGQARQRGMGGSGMELAAQLQAQQEGANLASRQGMDVAAQAQAAAQQAALQRAQLGGTMQDASFGRQAMTSQAQDAINRFNTENQNTATARNLDLRQALAGQNTMNRNMTNQSNVDLRNQANTYNVTQKPVAQFGMQSGKDQMVSGALQGAANMQAQTQAARFGAGTQMAGAALQGGGTALGGFLGRK